ncbi:YggS family pyridoxal phosphate-dependent enzyme [Streptomyces lydicus]|uniref:YggS family pyridoxal phosphate-dependent enzyme n=1 Tax=Streptomyces lydicus TaxID=47763 RepID=UPI0010132A2E|nr:YggS family pyridoxal phosphate-dependent enzyme [Streptomyces lydicus]MCZ1010271.1 YggS family pyridoxal phosphate-dependent enzyme [Streptomyces lydicus]
MRERLAALRARIDAAATAAGRRPEAVELLAVSKGHPASAIREALALGLDRFGESYAGEALPKTAELRGAGAQWVYLGPIQSNKTRLLAENFSWVLGLCSLKAARRLDAQRPDDLPPLQVCVQVNADGDPAKAGLAPDELDPFLESVRDLKRLTVRGLMTIPRKAVPAAPVTGPPAFEVLAELFAKQIAAGHRWDTLSMGMSGDFEAAIAAGSTQVRLGTALFGPRPAKPGTGIETDTGTGTPGVDAHHD